MGKKYLNGVDVSHWQSDADCKREFPSCDFVIFKATEGKTYKDKTLARKMQIAKDCGVKLFGLYHFYNSKKTATENASNFLETATKYLGNNDTLLVCDIEGQHAQNVDIFYTDIVEFCDIVFEETGIKPLVYTSASNVCKMSKLLEKDYGLWVAHYTKQSKPRTSIYGNMWALWQYTGSPIDRNYFNGTKKQFLAYCKQI